MGGRKPFRLAEEESWIRDRLAEKPDLTGRELCGELNERGVEVSYYAVWHFLGDADLSFKKVFGRAKRIAPPSRVGASNGNAGRIALPPRDWSSSTRPRPRPI